jgi:hypothetical protein
MRTVFPAHGWLPAAHHFELKWDDEGRDFATNWDGIVQAPGNGEVVRILEDVPFPNGFGPHYPVVRIDSGPWAGHEYYLGHTTALVSAGEHFSFGHPLSLANQGHNWAGTVGGWVELGEAFGGLPGPKATHHWFDRLISTPLVIETADSALVYGDRGSRVLMMTTRLHTCGYLPRRYWTFNRQVHGALVRFKRKHNLPVTHGICDGRTEVVLAHSAEVCRRTHKREV